MGNKSEVQCTQNTKCRTRCKPVPGQGDVSRSVTVFHYKAGIF